MKRFLWGAAVLVGVLAGCSSGGGGGGTPSINNNNQEQFNFITPTPGTNSIALDVQPNFSATQVTANISDTSSPTNHTSFSLVNNGGDWLGSGNIQLISGDTYNITVTGVDSGGQTVTGVQSYTAGGGSTGGGGNNTTTGITTAGGPPPPPTFP